MISVAVPARIIPVQASKLQNTTAEIVREVDQARQSGATFPEQPPTLPANPLIDIELTNPPFMDDFTEVEDVLQLPQLEDGPSFPDFLGADIDQYWSWLWNETGLRAVDFLKRVVLESLDAFCF